jgi:hypothetical protein
VLSAARLVHQTANLVVFTFPKSPDPPVVSVLLPEDRVDPPLRIQGGNEVVAVVRRAIGKFPGTSEIQQDAIEVNQFSRRFHGAIPVAPFEPLTSDRRGTI